MRVAFKEWAIVVAALGSGDQIVILRKGGVSEGRRGFQVDHSEFLLYPTHFHEHEEAIVPEAKELFDRHAMDVLAPDRVRLDYVAHVISWRRIESLAIAARLKGQHILRDEVITRRFDWGNDQNIYAMAVRVSALQRPVELPVLPAYGGCKSWVDLEEEIDVEGAAPVLDKEVFNEKLNQFNAALDWDEQPENELEKPA
jgi:hypothetical protein